MSDEYIDDMKSRAACLEYERAEFLSRPSIMRGIAIYPCGELYTTHDDNGIIRTVGDSPDEALRKWDEWFKTGKEK